MFDEEYSDESLIPENVKHLFKQSGESWKLMQPTEIKTVTDVNKLREGLQKERELHKATKAKYSGFADLDPTEVLEKLDRFAELEQLANGSGDIDQKVEQLTTTRINSKLAPVQRELDTIRNEKATLLEELEAYKRKDFNQGISEGVRGIAEKNHVRQSAVSDAIFFAQAHFEKDDSGNYVTKDGVGVTPGVGFDVWLTEMKNQKPHWWPESQGTGATGSNGKVNFANNPFSKDGWNVTEQMKLYKTDPIRAEQMAKSAGTTIGGKRPV